MTAEPTDFIARREFWSEERIALLIQRWAEGISASLIADEFGLTREAVLGKAWRLRQQGKVLAPRDRDLPLFQKPRGRPPRTPRVQPLQVAAPAPEPVVFTPSNPVTIIDLELSHCRWPVSGEKEATFYCGEKAMYRRPYCPYHHELGTRREAKKDGNDSGRKAGGGERHPDVKPLFRRKSPRAGRRIDRPMEHQASTQS
jgi:GcrA cell cycle regulator